MKNMSNKFECALGYHNYTIPSKILAHVLICENCKRKGHWKRFDGFEEWYEYDDNGNEIYYKDSTGFEGWYGYDDKGNVTHWRDSNGHEEWLNNEGYWTNKKPKNWKYEKYVKV
jgi:YD repeat-containing protein